MAENILIISLFVCFVLGAWFTQTGNPGLGAVFFGIAALMVICGPWWA